MNLGENIYRYRTRRGMSQDDLAAALEVSRQSVSKWENNNAVPELEKLIKMSRLFGVTLDELVGAPPPEPEAPAPQPTSGVTTGDLVSIVLLLIAVVFQLVIVFTSNTHNSMFLLILGLYVTPPLAAFGAAKCAPRSKLLFRVFTGYLIIAGIPAFFSLAQFGIVLFPLFVAPLAYWNGRLE